MRTEYCGLLRSYHIGKQVTLCGWVNKYRNLGSIVFVDMRDCEGVVQIFFDLNRTDVLKIASDLRNEFCIQVVGIVRARTKENINTEMITGNIEVLAEKLIILNRANSLPIDFNQINSEETRLKYRYLDLRRLEMSQYLRTRSKITNFVHRFMNIHNFLNIETPMLTRATPEGARDYLVPSRIHKSKFYALPQSPQLFKQLLMMSGFERYYQVVKCFRDENLRADRQPEFTQIDIETSFTTAEKVRKIMEKLVRNLWRKIKDVDLKRFPIMTFSESEHRFGSDKPDLRNPLELVDISDLLRDIEFFFFSNLAKKSKWHVSALKVSNKTLLSRKQIDNYNEFVKEYNIEKFIHFKVKENKENFCKIIGGIAKFLSPTITKEILKRVNAQDGDIIFLCSGNKRKVISAMGALRLKLGKDLNLTNQSEWAPAWIIDFPMFKEESEGCITATHHPFTSPKNSNKIELKNTPLKVIANSYDMVINGYEIGSGSVRIHDLEMQKTVFEILGIDEQEQNEKFGFLLEAMKFGTPPHAGFALGLDRLTMLLTGTDNIRDVIAFPKTTSASCLMTQAPSFIDKTALNELNIWI